ncbi:type II secretion system protein [Chitinivibrio alkaliphilus]|uniref:Type IV pilin PilA n=1 Tax=Chitinivibrio alkaliphilus ACht1 TaxID=1313304 RepID=U7D7H7_9BACT|nr:type II secretion system protein [Chitinivibrio alkaliphilus]ERP31883.1 type IV pilin PilA [Chitinivibrio alkaliphilus ACht1]
MNRKGFTLVELMVVIVIIGILAAVALPQMMGATDRARASEVPTMLRTIQNAQNAYYAATGEYGDWDAIGVEDPSKDSDFFDYELTLSGDDDDDDDGYDNYKAEAKATMTMGDITSGDVVASVNNDNERKSHDDFHTLAPNWRNATGNSDDDD